MFKNALFAPKMLKTTNIYPLTRGRLPYHLPPLPDPPEILSITVLPIGPKCTIYLDTLKKHDVS